PLRTPEMTSLSHDSYDLFVSYAHADDHDGWVRALVETLKETQKRFAGAQPWRGFFDCDCFLPLPPIFFRKSAASPSVRCRFWAYEGENPRFSAEKQDLDALNNYL